VRNSLLEQITRANMPMSDQLAIIDVVIAVWNGSGTIERAVRSALAEPAVNCVIVVDDQSTDDTLHVVSSLATELGDRIRVDQLENNGGPAAARNRGLALSKAPWIAILDSDDYFKPGRIRTLLDHSDGADFIADDPIQIKEGEDDSDPAAKSLLGVKEPIILDLETFVAGNISQKGRLRKEFGFLKPIIRRSFLERYQLRYEEALRLGEDFALYARALALGAVFKLVPSKTYVAVVRSDSISGNHAKKDLENLRDSDSVLMRLPTLTGAQRKLIQQHYESIDARIQWLNVIDAVKARNLRTFLPPFFVRRKTSFYLIGCLLEQVFVRSKNLMRQS
jgi:succinoglycan biosynthesis protein ExoU